MSPKAAQWPMITPRQPIARSESKWGNRSARVFMRLESDRYPTGRRLEPLLTLPYAIGYEICPCAVAVLVHVRAVVAADPLGVCPNQPRPPQHDQVGPSPCLVAQHLVEWPPAVVSLSTPADARPGDVRPDDAAVLPDDPHDLPYAAAEALRPCGVVHRTHAEVDKRRELGALGSQRGRDLAGMAVRGGVGFDLPAGKFEGKESLGADCERIAVDKQLLLDSTRAAGQSEGQHGRDQCEPHESSLGPVQSPAVTLGRRGRVRAREEADRLGYLQSRGNSLVCRVHQRLARGA